MAVPIATSASRIAWAISRTSSLRKRDSASFDADACSPRCREISTLAECSGMCDVLDRTYGVSANLVARAGPDLDKGLNDCLTPRRGQRPGIRPTRGRPGPGWDGPAHMLIHLVDTTDGVYVTAEERRLREAREGVPWRRWGPYLSERQWGTVREDYSDGGDAWNYFSHDQARSRAYRWGEDGLAGISDDQQRLCFALALWNGNDPILKERLFGLTNSESNHGEDVKEYYFYLDSTPTHSYMKYLYKYPQQAFPYSDVIETNRSRSREEFEYELLDTGIFDQDRYFDVFVEYAKGDPEDILIQISVHNRGPETAELHLLPTLWFRNTWSWNQETAKPTMRQVEKGSVLASHAKLGDRTLDSEGSPELLFTDNESNTNR